ncbi:MAG: HD domain-containing protein [Erysipelotrichaceae bacterium]|nr:HD domain-containing protein [Erysipelotrichaceae bacterium]
MEKWNDSFTDKINKEEVLLLALLHDLDKVMLLSEKCEQAGVNKMYSHGYLSALILNELKVGEKIVSLVAYHSPKACMHINDPLAMILHYADLFSADHIYMLVDRKPFYFGE